MRNGALARAALRDDLYGLQAVLAADVIRDSDGRPNASESIEEFVDANRAPAERTLQMLSDVNAGGVFDLSTLSVAVREVRNLANATEEE